MNKHWLNYITPCIMASVLALVFSIIGLVDVSQPGGLVIILFFFCLPALCIFIGADWLVKKITKGNLLYTWIIEIILIVIGLKFFPVARLSGC